MIIITGAPGTDHFRGIAKMVELGAFCILDFLLFFSLSICTSFPLISNVWFPLHDFLTPVGVSMSSRLYIQKSQISNMNNSNILIIAINIIFLAKIC